MGSQGQLCLAQDNLYLLREIHRMVHLGGLISHLVVPFGWEIQLGLGHVI